MKQLFFVCAAALFGTTIANPLPPPPPPPPRVSELRDVSDVPKWSMRYLASLDEMRAFDKSLVGKAGVGLRCPAIFFCIPNGDALLVKKYEIYGDLWQLERRGAPLPCIAVQSSPSGGTASGVVGWMLYPQADLIWRDIDEVEDRMWRRHRSGRSECDEKSMRCWRAGDVLRDISWNRGVCAVVLHGIVSSDTNEIRQAQCRYDNAIERYYGRDRRRDPAKPPQGTSPRRVIRKDNGNESNESIDSDF